MPYIVMRVRTQIKVKQHFKVYKTNLMLLQDDERTISETATRG